VSIVVTLKVRGRNLSPGNEDLRRLEATLVQPPLAATRLELGRSN